MRKGGPAQTTLVLEKMRNEAGGVRGKNSRFFSCEIAGTAL